MLTDQVVAKDVVDFDVVDTTAEVKPSTSTTDRGHSSGGRDRGRGHSHGRRARSPSKEGRRRREATRRSAPAATSTP
jgi:hypothetical protein